MTKTELLAALALDFGVDQIREQTTKSEGNLKFYSVRLLEIVGDNIRWRNSEFVVKNEGEAGEVAYWSPEQPKPRPIENKFIDDVRAYIATAVTAGNLEAAFIVERNPSIERALAWAYRLVNTEWVEDKVLFRRDGFGDIEHVVLANVKHTGS